MRGARRRRAPALNGRHGRESDAHRRDGHRAASMPAMLVAGAGLVVLAAIVAPRTVQAQFVCEDTISGTGGGATATGVSSVACGFGAGATGDFSSAYGASSTASGESSSAFGVQTADNATAVGFQAQASGTSSSAYSRFSFATGIESSAYGSESSAGASLLRRSRVA